MSFKLVDTKTGLETNQAFSSYEEAFKKMNEIQLKRYDTSIRIVPSDAKWAFSPIVNKFVWS